MSAILPLLAAAAGLLLVLIQRDKFSSRSPLFLLWLPSLINISALYWGLIYRLRYSVLLLPAVAIFGSLVLASAAAKKRTLILLLITATALRGYPGILSRLARRDSSNPVRACFFYLQPDCSCS